jgi:hypothetical protein
MHTIINPPPPSTPEGTPVVYIKEQVSQIYVRVYQNEFEIKDKTNTNNPLHV